MLKTIKDFLLQEFGKLSNSRSSHNYKDLIDMSIKFVVFAYTNKAENL